MWMCPVCPVDMSRFSHGYSVQSMWFVTEIRSGRSWDWAQNCPRDISVAHWPPTFHMYISCDMCFLFIGFPSWSCSETWDISSKTQCLTESGPRPLFLLSLPIYMCSSKARWNTTTLKSAARLDPSWCSCWPTSIHLAPKQHRGLGASQPRRHGKEEWGGFFSSNQPEGASIGSEQVARLRSARLSLL